jgi:hypothetical protein
MHNIASEMMEAALLVQDCALSDRPDCTELAMMGRSAASAHELCFGWTYSSRPPCVAQCAGTEQASKMEVRPPAQGPSEMIMLNLHAVELLLQLGDLDFSARAGALPQPRQYKRFA